MASTPNLQNTQLLFVPKPPTSKKLDSPTVRRRVQSAKEQRNNHLLIEPSLDRPRSAVHPSEKRTLLGSRRPPSAKTGKLLPGQLLKLDIGPGPSNEMKDHLRSVQPSDSTSRKTVKPKTQMTKASHQTDSDKKNDIEIPSGISALEPWLTPSVDQRLIGVDPRSCLVFLPTMTNYADLPVVPPPQMGSDQLPYSKIIDEEKPFNPKKLFHYNVLKNRPHSADHVCNHKRKEDTTYIQRIFCGDGKFLLDGSCYHRNRTKDIIKKEIEDLEQLLQGMGSDDSNNIIAQYQHDINALQKEVRETLSMFNRPKTISETSSDLMGLKAYLREKEQIIQRIKDRREKCIEELEQLDSDCGVKISIVHR